ncbi:hypothetical protein B0H11DRAFT_2245727 [Mycena galericulata]|nr:hypothetical protein B0H11DRAFT_2245727 [Mycena galericulata]
MRRHRLPDTSVGWLYHPPLGPALGRPPKIAFCTGWSCCSPGGLEWLRWRAVDLALIVLPPGTLLLAPLCIRATPLVSLYARCLPFASRHHRPILGLCLPAVLSQLPCSPAPFVPCFLPHICHLTYSCCLRPHCAPPAAPVLLPAAPTLPLAAPLPPPPPQPTRAACVPVAPCPLSPPAAPPFPPAPTRCPSAPAPAPAYSCCLRPRCAPPAVPARRPTLPPAAPPFPPAAPPPPPRRPRPSLLVLLASPLRPARCPRPTPDTPASCPAVPARLPAAHSPTPFDARCPPPNARAPPAAPTAVCAWCPVPLPTCHAASFLAAPAPCASLTLLQLLLPCPPSVA